MHLKDSSTNVARSSPFAFVPKDTRPSQAQGAPCPVFVHSPFFLLRPPQASSSPQDSLHILHQLRLVTYGAEIIPSRDNVSVLLEDSRLPGPSMDRLLQHMGSSMFPLLHTTSRVSSVQGELYPVARFQKGRNRCKWDGRVEEVLWAAVQLPSQQIPSLISHHCYSASAGRKQTWGPKQEPRCPKSS